MSSPFVGEVRAWACNLAPYGWAFCAGQLLSIQQNTALFSLIGTYYGGNGTTNFALPDLRGRAPLKYGNASSGDSYVIGETGGVENVTLNASTMPSHNHLIFGTSASGDISTPADGCSMAAASRSDPFYASTVAMTPINPGTVSLYQGGNLPHPNMQPYLAINWCIALVGIFPARN